MSDDEFLKMLGEVRTMLINYARMSIGNLLDAEEIEKAVGQLPCKYRIVFRMYLAGT